MTNHPKKDNAQLEAAARIASGAHQLSVSELIAKFRALGYLLDRSIDCRGTARYITGERAGAQYVAVGLYPVQVNDGISAWNINARRDDNYRAMQHLRQEVFAVARGAILEV